MRNERKCWPVAVGIILCVLTLALSIVLQEAGYLTYLNSDMASEIILARRQADTGSLVQMDWLYSTEIHTIHMNLLYALSFIFTDSFMWARIIGNTIGFVIGMASCVFLCRKLGLSMEKGLWTAALLPFASSMIYAANMTIGGYYIIHLPFAFLGAGLWLEASSTGIGKKRALMSAGLFALLCMLEGLLSVRYVLCFICPMVVVAGLDMLLAPKMSRTLRDHRLRFGGVTAMGFMACLTGFVLSEVLYPRLFVSGTGSAASFMFNPLDSDAMASMLWVVLVDFLKLLGWRGNVPLFSLEGIANLCIAVVLVLGGVMTRRVYRALDTKESMERRQKRMMDYAFWAFGVNLFCYMFIQGTYLNRYLILAVLFFLPALTIVLTRERNAMLKLTFLASLAMMMLTAGGSLVLDTRAQREQAENYGADMMDAAQVLMDQGYTHGYGDFWDIRVMQERTQGALTFAGIVAADTEEGAVCEKSIDMIRWLEPADASHMDVCEGKTFMILRESQKQNLAPWLELTGAPVIYENDTYTVYGFESSQQMTNWMLLGKMKLENAVYEDGVLTMGEGARMRVPTAFREAGKYALTFVCEGEPARDSRMSVYTTGKFIVTGEQTMDQGENRMVFELEQDDKYFIILLTGGQAKELKISQLMLQKMQ